MVAKIAITGNIAAGKSEIEKILINKGYKVFDTDIIAHDILNQITEFYNYDVFTNGKIDRTKLGRLVFSDNNIKQKLEAIIHPKVKDEILNIFKEQNNENFVFISVPLLYETGFDKLFDKVLLITTDKNIQLKRLMQRNNLSENDALLRINSQISQDIKIKNADFIIENNSDLTDLNRKIDEFLKELLKLCL